MIVKMFMRIGKCGWKRENVLIILVQIEDIYCCQFFYRVHLDVNECDDNNGGCSDNCTNTEGTFNCDCPHGWKMGPNGFTCEGIYLLLRFKILSHNCHLLLLSPIQKWQLWPLRQHQWVKVIIYFVSFETNNIVIMCGYV